MHSAIFAVFAISGLAAASPNPKPQAECEGLAPLGLDTVKYYVCGKNGFRGYCSEDPCDAEWCRDFAPKTCDLVFITEPEAPVVGGHKWESETATTTVTEAASTDLPIGQCAPGTGFFQNCSNGFVGCCKSDACTGDAGVCPDTKEAKRSDPTVCPPGTGFFQSCSNGFRGCCKSDACGQKLPICPPSVTKRSADPTVCPPGTGFFQSCSNGFRGCCKGDACGQKEPICPSTATKRSDDPTVCPPGTGFFQSCSNGFRGCCKNDACSQTRPICPSSSAKRSDDPTVCAPGTGFFQSCSNGFRGCCKTDACSQTQPICPSSAAKRDDTVCPPGTGFFQSCSNGFRGCCKGDACGNSWCPDFKTGTYQPAQSFKVKAHSDGTCAPGTGFFQVCSNGFKGCCKKDACGQKQAICPN
ncbi:hypothetical protein HYE67_005803 [Fusarium culmorum]|uniref:Uncharacterized protein n=1 Tax=Fusarium culmorum TaxID=5516 RepID=A0A2T4GER9_FUSCU|nr:hypothetical protein FCULG_00010425 [Fusarium culmorum]QPC63572.1 hypothetical protein HYE67_005803 [Fusarium culmorum]